MIQNDPLIRALQTADAAAGPLQLPADLAQRVRQRRAHQVRSAKRWKIGIAVTAAATLIVIAASFHAWQPLVPPGGTAPMDAALAHNPRAEPGANNLSATEIARLRTEADALGTQADALQRQLTAAHDEQTRQDLRDEYRRQLAVNAQTDTDESPIDRAAAIALCQGDYYRDQQARQPAQAAYQSVLDNFPHSHWAEVARERLDQFQMN